MKITDKVVKQTVLEIEHVDVNDLRKQLCASFNLQLSESCIPLPPYHRAISKLALVKLCVDVFKEFQPGQDRPSLLELKKFVERHENWG